MATRPALSAFASGLPWLTVRSPLFQHLVGRSPTQCHLVGTRFLVWTWLVEPGADAYPAPEKLRLILILKLRDAGAGCDRGHGRAGVGGHCRRVVLHQRLARPLLCIPRLEQPPLTPV